MIAISIATKAEDASLNTLKPACNATDCLQLVYGAVIFRAQKTLPQFLGTLSRQASHDVPAPISTYTNVPRITSDHESITPVATSPSENAAEYTAIASSPTSDNTDVVGTSRNGNGDGDEEGKNKLGATNKTDSVHAVALAQDLSPDSQLPANTEPRIQTQR